MKMRCRLVLGFLAGLSACKEADSVVLVNVSINSDVSPVYSLRVAISTTHAHDSKVYPTTSSATAIPVAASFAIVLPRSRTGLLDLALDGVDNAGNNIAHGTAQTVIVVGGTATISVILAASASLCGNGVTDPGESCDDGNVFSFDGCDFRCQAESAQADAGSPDYAMADTANDDASTLDGTTPDTEKVDAGPADTTTNYMAIDSQSPQDSMVDLAAPDVPSNLDAGNPATGGDMGTGGATGTGGVSTGVGGTTSPGGTTGVGGTMAGSLDGSVGSGGSTSDASMDLPSTSCSPVPASAGGISCPAGVCTVGTNSGSAFTVTDGLASTLICMSANSLCAAGSMPLYDGTHWGAEFGFYLSPASTSANPVPVQLGGSGVSVTLNSLSPTGAFARAQVTVNGVDYCANLSATSTTIPWTSFNTACWNGTGTALAGAPAATTIMFQVPSVAFRAQAFDFCVTSLKFE